jgi:demethylmenaquinone methyltransferase/2-methoxy-6-polyprenyl-1,4-benzoquinol methylase
MDQRWRKKAVKLAELKPNDYVLDVACGTGDLTEAFRDRLDVLSLFEPRNGFVLGLDFTYPMLTFARRKSEVRDWLSSIDYLNGDALSLPLAEQTVDVVSIAFGIRNVADPAAALVEFYRVLRPGGRVIVLEFSLPTNPVLRGMYNFYFRKILPRTATWISGDKSGAYRYLPESVNTFISREQMVGMLERAGFAKVEQFPLTFGVCVCYRGVKP